MIRAFCWFTTLHSKVFCLPVDYRKDVLPPCEFYQNLGIKKIKIDDRMSFLFLREFGGSKCEIWIFHDGKSSSILFQRVWWLKIDCTLFLSPPNWIKTFKLNSLQTSPFLEKFLRSKGMKLFDRKVLWQIESQGKGGHLFLLGCWKKRSTAI